MEKEKKIYAVLGGFDKLKIIEITDPFKTEPMSTTGING